MFNILLYVYTSTELLQMEIVFSLFGDRIGF